MKFHKYFKFFRPLIRKLKIGNFEFRLKMNALKRMQYAYICFNAAKLGKQLGYKKISVVEYGVAGGQGLLILEKHVKEIESYFNIEIEIYGFDTGEGLPEPTDYRDLPYFWKKGFFQMEKDRLKNRLNKSKIVMGNINETSKSFFAEYSPAPIGAVIHDFDFYSATKVALSMMKNNENYFLPRVFSYFDDTIGNELSLFNDYTGERLAINEFNKANDDIKICEPYHLRALKSEVWHHQIWICHFFRHRKYNEFINSENLQLNI